MIKYVMKNDGNTHGVTNELDSLDSQSIGYFRKSKDPIIRDIIRKINILLYIQKRSRRGVPQESPEGVSQDISFLYFIMKFCNNGCSSSSKELCKNCKEILMRVSKKGFQEILLDIDSAGIEDIFKQQPKNNDPYDTSLGIVNNNNCHSTSKWLSGENLSLGKYSRKYRNLQEIKKDGWKNIKTEEIERTIGFPCLGINWDTKMIIHSFVILGKIDENLIGFEQYGAGGKWRFFIYSPDHYGDYHFFKPL